MAAFVSENPRLLSSFFWRNAIYLFAIGTSLFLWYGSQRSLDAGFGTTAVAQLAAEKQGPVLNRYYCCTKYQVRISKLSYHHT